LLAPTWRLGPPSQRLDSAVTSCSHGMYLRSSLGAEVRHVRWRRLAPECSAIQVAFAGHGRRQSSCPKSGDDLDDPCVHSEPGRHFGSDAREDIGFRNHQRSASQRHSRERASMRARRTWQSVVGRDPTCRPRCAPQGGRGLSSNHARVRGPISSRPSGPSAPGGPRDLASPYGSMRLL
jgi:hypothetical protein